MRNNFTFSYFLNFILDSFTCFTRLESRSFSHPFFVRDRRSSRKGLGKVGGREAFAHMLEGCIRVPPIVWWLYCGCIFEVPATIADRSVAPEPSSAPSGVSFTGGPGSNQSRETKRATHVFVLWKPRRLRYRRCQLWQIVQRKLQHESGGVLECVLKTCF